MLRRVKRQEREFVLSSQRLEGSCVVRELRNREEPISACLNFLRPRRLQRRLSCKEGEDTANTGAVATGRHFNGLLRAGEEVANGCEALRSRLKRVVARPDLNIDLLLHRPDVLPRSLGTNLCFADVVHVAS